MALPDEFSEWEHLQSTIIRVHNRLVREEFSDLGGESWDPDIGSSRGSLRHACTLKDNDTADMLIQRYLLFYFTMRKAKDLQGSIVGIHKDKYDQYYKYRPQITLFFREDNQDVEAGYKPVEGQITLRLEAETSESITETELTSIANRIRSNFGGPTGYIWRKGKDEAIYWDKSKANFFRLYTRNKPDAKELLEKALNIKNDTPNWEHLQYKEPDQPTEKYPTIPPNIRILNKTKKEPRRRPIAEVRFQYAYANLWGKPNSIYLYDRTLSHPEAYVNL